MEARKGGGPEGWEPEGWEPEGWGPQPRKSGGPKGGGQKGGGEKGGGQKGGGPNPEKVGARRVGAKSGGRKGGGSKGGGPKGGRPKISRFFFPLPPQNSFFSSLSGGLLVDFWWCLKRRGTFEGLLPFARFALCSWGIRSIRPRITHMIDSSARAALVP